MSGPDRIWVNPKAIDALVNGYAALTLPAGPVNSDEVWPVNSDKVWPAYIRNDPAALAASPTVQAMIGAVIEPHEKSYIDLHTKAFAVLQWFETARPDLIGPRIEALKVAIYGPRPYGEAHPDAATAYARALEDARSAALDEVAAMCADMAQYPASSTDALIYRSAAFLDAAAAVRAMKRETKG